MSAALTQATFGLQEIDLPRLVLTEEDLPSPYLGYKMVRDGHLDNRTMAEHGFHGATEEKYRDAGRITGFLREFGSTAARVDMDGVDFLAASVAHLFETPAGVLGWMRDIFVKDFMDNIGADLGNGQTLVGVEEVSPEGFFDEAVGLKAVHDSSGRTISSTVIDFRVGRILGVVFVATVGDHFRLDEATELGIAMEKHIVRVAFDM